MSLFSVKKISRNLVLRIKFFFKQEFFNNKLVLGALAVAFFVNLVNWLALKIWIEPVDLPIVLHYNVYFGVDVLGDWQKVFLSPVLGLILFLINIGLGLYFYRQKERIASYIILLGNLMLQFCFLIYSISLVIINY